MSNSDQDIQQLSFESTDDLGKNRLQVKVNSMAEVIVIDGSYRVVGRRVGGFNRKLPVGVYEVKVRVGDEVESRTVNLDGDLTEVFTLGEILAPSPAPLNPEDINDSVLAEIQNFYPEAGLKVAVRGQKGDLADAGFTLFSPTGEALQSELKRTMDDSMLLLAFPQADAGAYRLSVNLSNGGSLSTALWVNPDLQTQVFIAKQKVSSIGTEETMLDLSSMAVDLLAKSLSVAKARKSWQMTESARATLGLSTRIAPLQQTLQAVRDSHPSAMLALLGCHQLAWLLDAPDAKVEKGLPTLDELAPIVKRLEELLPGCPDVEALKCRVLSDTSAMLTSPPMLHLSWSLLMPQSNTFTLPSGQYRDQAGSPITTHRPWFVWQSR